MSTPPAPDAADLRAAADDPVTVVTPGSVPYGTARAWQRRLAERRAAGEITDVLLLLEHPRVYTAGRRADEDNLVFDAEERAERGIELSDTDRGGDFTYHGPGQLVGYPIVELADRRVVDYVRALEEINIRVAASYGLAARRVEGYTGVWMDDEKLTAIGVRVLASGVTQHGWATNVTTDLSDFEGIVPCGIADRGVCSLASLGVQPTMDQTIARTLGAFREVFGCSLASATLTDLSLSTDEVLTP